MPGFPKLGHIIVQNHFPPCCACARIIDLPRDAVLGEAEAVEREGEGADT